MKKLCFVTFLIVSLFTGCGSDKDKKNNNSQSVSQNTMEELTLEQIEGSWAGNKSFNNKSFLIVVSINKNIAKAQMFFKLKDDQKRSYYVLTESEITSEGNRFTKNDTYNSCDELEKETFTATKVRNQPWPIHFNFSYGTIKMERWFQYKTPFDDPTLEREDINCVALKKYLKETD